MSMEIEYRSVADFGEIITGKTPSTSVDEFWNGEIPFITPTDIVGYDMRYIFSTERQITDEGANSQINTILPQNTICVSCIASIGKMCITSAAQSITNQQINSIVVKKGYDYQYLFYLLRYFLPYIQLIGGGTGSGTPIISKTKFSKLKYPVCVDKGIQARIAVILSTYDSLIEVNNKRIKVLEQMAENLYKEWFVRFRFPGHEIAEFENGIPKGWNVCRFSSIANVLSGGTPSTEHDEYYGGNIPFYTPKDSLDNYFVFDTISNLTEEGLQHCNSQLYPKNTIMITARGTVGNLNLLAKPMAMNQSCYALTSNTIPSQYFLFFLIKREILKLRKMASGGVFDTIIVSTFDHIKVTIPDESLIMSFDRLVSPILDETYTLLKQNRNLIRQRDLLLPRLMSGKLEVL